MSNKALQWVPGKHIISIIPFQIAFIISFQIEFLCYKNNIMGCLHNIPVVTVRVFASVWFTISNILFCMCIREFQFLADSQAVELELSRKSKQQTARFPERRLRW